MEALIAATITGILVAIAVPSYRTYQAKTRQNEAKIALASIYTTQKNFFVQKGTYTHCLKQIGYDPTNSPVRYYATGIDVGNDITNQYTRTQCGLNANQACNAYNWTLAGAVLNQCAISDIQFPETASIKAGVTLVTSPYSITTPTTTRDTFRGAAQGYISNQGVDLWWMDQNKYLVNLSQGI